MAEEQQEQGAGMGKTGMRARLGVVTATAAVCAACVAPGAAHAGTLDQQQTAWTYPAGIGASQTLAQVFTAGRTGRLDRADLLLNKISSPTETVYVQIRSSSSGDPGAAILAAASVPPSSIGATLAFVPVMFAARPSVVAGRQYALIAYSANPNNKYGWGIADAPDVYARGHSSWTSASPPTGSSVWSGDGGQDLAFKTYVKRTGKRARALKKCKSKHSKKARKKCQKKAKKLPV